MRSARKLVVVACALLLLVAASADARKKKGGAPTQPGTYTDWNDDLDRVEIVETFKLADYQRLVVGAFDTAGVELPDADDNTYQPVKQVLQDVVSPLIEGLEEEPPGIAIERQQGDASGKGTLLLRGRVLEMDPGSKAARYWAGFGAGAARAKLDGELVDAASGRVLLRFTQERRSGVGAFGGDYVKLMQRNLRAIGEDLAAGLQRF